MKYDIIYNTDTVGLYTEGRGAVVDILSSLDRNVFVT